ncbi:MAG: hypothetical protein ACREIV_02670, partial [Planctomycetaceae bacterium]
MNDHHLHIPERDIRRNGPGFYPRVFLRQRRTERALEKRGVRFRRTEPQEVEAAYSAMSADEFDAVNGRQNWG